MNKTLTMSLAALGVVGMIGGGTFAAWSDFAEINGNESGAGVLTLDVSAGDGVSAAPTFTIDDMVPGSAKEQHVYLVNRDSDAVPLANLTMSFENVVQNENGCSSNSEAVAEGGTDVATGDADCAVAGDAGEWGAQANHQWLQSAATSAADCVGAGYGSLDDSTHNDTLTESLGKTYDLGDLGPGEGVCLRMNTSLPIGATDAVQGDSVSFDVQFDLVQITP